MQWDVLISNLFKNCAAWLSCFPVILPLPGKILPVLLLNFPPPPVPPPQNSSQIPMLLVAWPARGDGLCAWQASQKPQGSLASDTRRQGCCEHSGSPGLPRHCLLERKVDFWNKCTHTTKTVRRGGTRPPSLGRPMKCQVGSPHGRSSALANLAALQDGGIWPFRASPHLVLLCPLPIPRIVETSQPNSQWLARGMCFPCQALCLGGHSRWGTG